MHYFEEVFWHCFSGKSVTFNYQCVLSDDCHRKGDMAHHGQSRLLSEKED